MAPTVSCPPPYDPLVFFYAVAVDERVSFVKKSSSATLEKEASNVPITRRCGLMLKHVALQSLMIPGLITKLKIRFHLMRMVMV